VRPYTLPGSEVHRIASRAVGDTFEISVALPPDYGESERRYPVVLATDADLAFAAEAQIARLMQFGGEAPAFILVGVGYGDFDVALRKRRRDLTPTVDGSSAACAAPGACGGAERFVTFIQSELLPFVEGRYRIDREDMTLLGNSLGGLFDCYVLLRHPGLFRRYLVGSPTVTWDGGWALKAAPEATPGPALETRVFVGVGGDEGDGVAGARSFVARLRALGPEDLSVSFRVFEGERHMSAQPMIVSRGLHVLFEAAPGEVPNPRP
jgi:predicted alpha/beta superfamily hydrolase